MKRILLISLILFGCSDDNTVAPTPTVTCSTEFNHLTTLWIIATPVSGFEDTVEFSQNMYYYEEDYISINPNATPSGTWTFTNNCDSINQTPNSWVGIEFSYRIINLNSDTLEIENPISGTAVYIN